MTESAPQGGEIASVGATLAGRSTRSGRAPGSTGRDEPHGSDVPAAAPADAPTTAPTRRSAPIDQSLIDSVRSWLGDGHERFTDEEIAQVARTSPETGSMPKISVDDLIRGFAVVRLLVADTGEVKEQAMAGVERTEYHQDWPWQQTALELALGLVPDLVDAIDRARLRGHSVEVRVCDGEEGVTNVDDWDIWQLEGRADPSVQEES